MGHHHQNNTTRHVQVILNFHQLSRLYGPSIQVHSFKVSPCGNKFAIVLFDPSSSSTSPFLFQGPCLVKSSPQHDWVEVAALGDVGDVEWCSHGNGLVATKYMQHDDGGGKVVLLYYASRTTTTDGGVLHVLWEQNTNTGDASATIQLTQCKDNSYIMMNSMTKRSSEISLIRSADPLGSENQHKVLTVHPRRQGLEYFVEHHQGSLYILSNAQGMVNWGMFTIDLGRLYRESHLVNNRGLDGRSRSSSGGGGAVVSTVSSDEWQCLLPERQGVALEDIDVFGHGMVVHERESARQQLRYLPSSALHAAAAAANGESDTVLLNSSKVVPLPEWAHDVVPGANADYNSSTFRMRLSSPVHPPQHYDYHLESGRLEKLAFSIPGSKNKNKKYKVSNGFVEMVEGGQCHQVHIPASSSSSSSSVKIPMTLAYKQSSSSPLSPSPCLIMVYGAYGACHIQPGWEEYTAAMVDKGWILAHAHVRGGGEKGRRWHLDGVMDTKHNSITDLGDCIQWLVDNGYTEYAKLVVWGKSAGAVTVAGYLNRSAATASCCNEDDSRTKGKHLSSSSIVRGAILETPFLDMVGEMTDPALDRINAREGRVG